MKPIAEHRRLMWAWTRSEENLFSLDPDSYQWFYLLTQEAGWP